jgi:hypothetical protein
MPDSTIFDTCVPRQELLTGELRDEMFAARLNDVVLGKAHPIYQDPEQFFPNTHPTARVRSFLKEVMGRLSGTDATASALFRLDTPFGGGKTHTLIALYHLMTSRLSQPALKRLGLSPGVLSPGQVKVIAVVGDDLDPANGVEKDGIRVHHLWGELAFQLGGHQGYALVERSDKQGQAPGPQFLDRLIGSQATLILVDEPALYMRKMGPLANQLPAFLKTLAEWVTTSGSRTVLVFTLAADAFAREAQELREALERSFQEATAVTTRPAKVVTPAQAEDIAPILRQRLFQRVDMDAAGVAGQAYFDCFRRLQQHGAPLPVAATQASYKEAIQKAYPFHPALIEVLDGKLATIPNFQKTRGALRLLARVVRRLWELRPADCVLIHPFSLDLADPDLVDEVTGRLDRPAFRSVVSYDIARADGQAHAQTVDRERFSGHPPYTQRVATLVFLHSLPEPPARGVDLDELLAATVTPDSDPAHLQKALQYLLDEAYHLDFEGNRYFFRTEPSLNKIVIDETQAVPLHEARAEVERRIKQLWRDAGLEVQLFPNEPADLPDEAKGRLVLLHWDTAGFLPGDKAAPERIRELWEYAGAQRGFRRFRNTVFFLVADADRRERMLNQARRWLALDRLLRDTRKLDEYKLGKEHRQRLEEWRKEANLQARLGITRAYCHLFYPVGEIDSPYRPFAHQTLQIEDQGEPRANHTETVLRVLRELNKVKSADDAPLSPALVKRDAFAKDEASLVLQALFERFAERVRLPLLLEPTYLKEIVRLGIRGKVWLYYDRAANLAYDTDADLPDLLVDEQHEVITPEEAKARGIPIYRKEKPPPKPGEEEGPKPPPIVKEAKAEGEPRRALADLAALARDAGWKSLASLQLLWQADGQDAQARLGAIRTILGQVPGAKVSLDVSLACQFPDAAEWSTSFKGPVGHYLSLASPIENLVGQAQDAHATVTLLLEFAKGLAVGGPEYQDLRDALDLANLGRTGFTAQPLAAGVP